MTDNAAIGANEYVWTKSNAERHLRSSPCSRRRLIAKRPTETTGPRSVSPASIERPDEADSPDRKKGQEQCEQRINDDEEDAEARFGIEVFITLLERRPEISHPDLADANFARLDLYMLEECFGMSHGERSRCSNEVL